MLARMLSSLPPQVRMLGPKWAFNLEGMLSLLLSLSFPTLLLPFPLFLYAAVTPAGSYAWSRYGIGTTGYDAYFAMNESNDYSVNYLLLCSFRINGFGVNGTNSN